MMRIFKSTLLTVLLLVSFTSLAREDNVFLSRDFWKENPGLDLVKQKISEGNDATVFNGNGFDAVVYALLEKADDAVIEYLLTLDGNSVDKRTHDSRTYLHWAAYAGKTAIMKTLLAKGASVSAVGSHGNTPLTFAAGAGQTNTAVYDLLIENGVELAKEENKNGANALLLLSPSLENEKQLAYFINKGLALNSTDDDGNGIFNYAAQKGNVSFLKLLVKKGIDYKALNKNGGNAFVFAAKGARGYTNTIGIYKYLKALGLNPVKATKDGDTPLHHVAYNTTDLSIVKFFMAEGAAVNQKDAGGNTPFLRAASNNTLKVLKLLSEKIDDFETSNHKGQTALMQAVWKNNPEVVEFLLQKGAGVKVTDKDGNTLAYYLLKAFDAEHPENFDAKLKMLQPKGLEMNHTQGEGNTLYHLAAKANDLALLKRLADFDIAVNAKNDEGLTALHLAAMKANDDQLMKYLIAKGADSKIKTDFEETPYDLANENELLQKKNVDLEFLKE